MQDGVLEVSCRQLRVSREHRLCQDPPAGWHHTGLLQCLTAGRAASSMPETPGKGLCYPVQNPKAHARRTHGHQVLDLLGRAKVRQLDQAGVVH